MKKHSFYILAWLVIMLNNAFGTAYTVNSNAGTNTGASTSGTLLYCISQANAAGAGPHTITFAAAMAGQTITCAGFGNYNFTNSNITLDGTTLTGYTCGLPKIKIDVSGVGGFRFNGSNNMVKGIAFIGWFDFQAGSGNSVQACTFHIELDGTTVTVPATVGQATFYISGGTGSNKIGGYTDCERNIIASVGSRAYYNKASTTNNVFKGNYCGTLRDGLTATTASSFAAQVVFYDNNSAGDSINSNIIARGTLGIYNNGAGKIFIYNNYVGADKNGLFQANLALSNAPIAIKGGNADNSEIVGNVTGNTSYIGGYSAGTNIGIWDPLSDNIIIKNNYIGVDLGFNKSGSAWAGIYTASGNITITGNYVGDNGIRNLAQYSHGIATENASNVTISNNYVGVTPSGGNVGNGDAGIEVNGGSTISITGNVIGFNKGMRTQLAGALGSGGIQLINAPSIITVSNNYIGTTPSIVDAGNLYDGIYTEKATTITISQNKIAYNDRHGINVAYKTGGGGGASDKVFITKNCMWCNTSKGIYLTMGGNLNNTNGGATSYGKSYTIGGTTYTSVIINPFSGVNKSDSTTTVGTLVINGIAPINSYVEIFKVEPCKGCGSSGNEEGQVYLGNTTANASGQWTFSIPTNNIGRGIVATASSANASPAVTSEFSSCLALTNQCNIASNVAMSPTNGPISVCSGDLLSFTGSFTMKPYAGCPNMYNVAWYRDATLLSGPTQNTTGSASYSKTVAASGDNGIYAFTVSDALPQAPACLSKDTVKVIYGTCAPLNISLVEFKGQPIDANQNEVSWILDTDEYGRIEIERSFDGRNFTVIDTRFINPSLTNDFTVDRTNSSIAYYRIKVIPSSSKAFYSSVITVSKNATFNVDVIGATETYLNLRIVSGIDDDVNYAIYDTRGIIVAQSSFHISSGVTNKQINLLDVKSAVYIIKCDGTKNRSSERKLFVKQ